MTKGERLAWASGFLEGEGSFTANRKQNGSAYLRITAVQVEREPLERLREWFGGSIHRHRREGVPGKGNRRDLYVWTLGGDAAIALMHELRPWLSRRRNGQIDAIIGKSTVARPSSSDQMVLS